MVDPIVEGLRAFDTPTLSDALERLNLHSRREGYAAPGLHCFSAPRDTIVGFAATARIRAADAPVLGQRYFRHSGWWEQMNQLPEPRVVVIEDVDRRPGAGACVGLAGAALFRALKCDAAITNGAVRDVSAIRQTGFGLFAAHLSPSHGYAHLVDYGQPVSIFDLPVTPGDLLAADRHGVIALPFDRAEELVALAREVRQRRRTFVDFCTSGQFSLDDLDTKLKELNQL